MAAVTVVAALVLSGCGGGAGGSDAVTGATVPLATTTTLDLAHLPPHPQASQADFDAIVRELNEIRNEAYRRSDPQLLSLVYAGACKCLALEGAVLMRRREMDWHLVGGAVAVVKVEFDRRVSPDGVVLRVRSRTAAGEVVDSAGRVVKVLTEEVTGTHRFFLRRVNSRWQIRDFERVAEAAS